jgi:pimeloyl-ACP methyl ester carboxylesterase
MAHHSLTSLLSSAALALLAGGSLAAAARLPGRSDNSTADCTGVLALSPRCSSDQAPYARDVFYVGGRYYGDDTGNRITDQLYVEKLTPAAVTQSKPVVFLHGGGGSGVSWLNTPDNRKGFGMPFAFPPPPPLPFFHICVSYFPPKRDMLSRGC